MIKPSMRLSSIFQVVSCLLIRIFIFSVALFLEQSMCRVQALNITKQKQ